VHRTLDGDVGVDRRQLLDAVHQRQVLGSPAVPPEHRVVFSEGEALSPNAHRLQHSAATTLPTNQQKHNNRASSERQQQTNSKVTKCHERARPVQQLVEDHPRVD
jgi:uncharacterized protein YgbK (DUF1537 family)